MTCPIWWLAECAVSVEESIAPVAAQVAIPSTGIPAIDALLALVASLGTGAGGMWLLNIWRARQRSDDDGNREAVAAHAAAIAAAKLAGEHAVQMSALAERQEATAAELGRVAQHLVRVDEHLRDARERLSKIEGREGL